MAIKIEIEAASAAEMHAELKALLFGATGPVLKTAGPIDLPKGEPGKFIEVEGGDASEGKEQNPDTAKEDKPKTRRRTKAEIEAEKKAQEKPETEQPESEESATEKAPETHEEPEEVLNPAPEKKAAKVYDVNDLRQLAVSKGTPKKPGIANILKKYGVQTFPQLSSEDMQKVYAEIEVL